MSPQSSKSKTPSERLQDLKKEFFEIQEAYNRLIQTAAPGDREILTQLKDESEHRLIDKFRLTYDLTILRNLNL